MKKTAQRLWKIFMRRLNKPSKRLRPMEIVISLDSTKQQKINRFKEKSGASNSTDLLSGCFSSAEKLVDHEIRGGTIILVNKDGTREDFSILEEWKDPADDWKDF